MTSISLENLDHKHRKPQSLTMDRRRLKANIPLIIPENTDHLINEFLLQIADTESGKNNSFSYTNALMKEMLFEKENNNY